MVETNNSMHLHALGFIIPSVCSTVSYVLSEFKVLWIRIMYAHACNFQETSKIQVWHPSGRKALCNMPVKSFANIEQFAHERWKHNRIQVHVQYVPCTRIQLALYARIHFQSIKSTLSLHPSNHRKVGSHGVT